MKIERMMGSTKTHPIGALWSNAADIVPKSSPCREWVDFTIGTCGDKRPSNSTLAIPDIEETGENSKGGGCNEARPEESPTRSRSANRPPLNLTYRNLSDET